MRGQTSLLEHVPPCDWCGEPIPAGKRADSRFCGKRCRQASWRFGQPPPRAVVASRAAAARRFAYADPPYPGMAHLYEGHPDYAGEVDHPALVDQLVADYPDGWALSTSSKTLTYVLALVAERAGAHRIGAWTKPAPPTRSYRARSAWEPVIFVGGRPRDPAGPMVLDWLHAAPPRRLPGQVVGTKPSAFAWWIFEQLGAQPHDRLDDLFPGSGAIGRAWQRWTAAEPAAA